MMQMHNNIQQVSALVDGELNGAAVDEALHVLAADQQALHAWETYHLIGDVLRSPELGALGVSPGFMSRLSERLAAEGVPSRAPDEAVSSVGPVAARMSANDGLFRWKLAAGFASFAAIASVGWTLTTATLSPASQLASAPAQATQALVLAGSEQGAMLRDPRLDELLAAHRQVGAATALQAPGGFLHNATFETPAR